MSKYSDELERVRNNGLRQELEALERRVDLANDYEAGRPLNWSKRLPPYIPPKPERHRRRREQLQSKKRIKFD